MISNDDINRARVDALLNKAQEEQTALERARREDGTPIPSTLDLIVYTSPSLPKTCDACGRPTTYFDGCSLVECPQRYRANGDWK